MVVVVVRKQHDVYRWQVLQRDGRSRAREAKEVVGVVRPADVKGVTPVIMYFTAVV